MRKEGYRPSTIRGAVKNLKALSRHCNILNPESLKAYLATSTYGENNKDKILGDMARFYKSLNIAWHRPLSRRVETLPFIPLESEIDQLIGGLGPKLSVFTRIVKETGMAMVLDKVIVPLKTKKVKRAHGFLESYNYLSLRTAALDTNRDGILQAVYSHGELRNKTRWSLVEALNASDSFDEANERSERLLKCGPFNKRQIDEIFRGFLKNNQIYVPTVAGRNVSNFLITNRRHIGRELSLLAKKAKRRLKDKTQGFDYDEFLNAIGSS